MAISMFGSKEQLAKLLATEDIHVRINKELGTAAFDTKNRILYLPDWSLKDRDVLDLLTGHEVGHALWTLNDNWQAAAKQELYHKGILNIVEDARIEKKIKRKYPGITKQFVKGYKKLANDNFFWKAGEQPEDFDFINRLNLHFKMGALSGIPFYDTDEQALVDMVADVESWQDVLDATIALMSYAADNMDEYDEDWDPMEFRGLGAPGESNGDKDEGTAEGDESNAPKGSAGDDGQDGNENGDTVSSDISADLKEKLEDLMSMLPDDLASTQDRFDEKMEELTNSSEEKRDQIVYFSLPEANLKTILLGYKDCLKEMQQKQIDIETSNKEVYSDSPHAPCVVDYLEKFTKFKNSSQKIINYMVKEFERKKAAKEYRRESISKTGVLDVNKLYSYKYNEDIFLKKILKPDGKNHGMIMLVDWSGSMNQHLHDTIKQMLTLVWFCNKVNIPFEVYAFSNNYRSQEKYRKEDESQETWAKRVIGSQPWIEKVGNACFDRDNFKLLNFFSSRMNASQLNNMAKIMWRIGQGFSNRYYHQEEWGNFELGATPLVEGLVTMNKIIPMFKNYHKIDKMNLIVLSDGDGNTELGSVKTVEGSEYMSTRYATRGNLFLEDPLTKRTYNMADMHEEDGYWPRASKMQERAILCLLKDRYDLNVVGIFLDSSANGKALSARTLKSFIGDKFFNKEGHDKARKECRKTGCAGVNQIGYNEYYIVPTGTIREVETSLDVDRTMTVGKITNAFKKQQSNKFGNKILVNRMMDIIC